MKTLCSRVALALGLLLALSPCVYAEHFQGDPDWRVAFTTGKEMESNFKTADLDEAVSGLQPGDDITFTLALENQYGETTDWWMTNEVLYSLEDRSQNSATGGGAYTYLLTYTDKSGSTNTLFSSDTVGGDTVDQAGEGLHEATDALEDYFYLDTLSSGQQGTITLTVALEGETQGNDYQDTLADLQMNFAVELRTATTAKPEIVKTGDDSHLLFYMVAMGLSGLVLLVLGISSLKRGKQQGRDAV
jgi:hypothetical protein